MSEIKRYMYSPVEHRFIPHRDGHYLIYADMVPIIAERDRLKVENGEQKSTIKTLQKTCNAQMEVLKKKHIENERLRKTLEYIRICGHDDECLMCALKDKAVEQALKEDK